MLRFKVLVVDHDDTAVDSTTHIHWPAHVEFMNKARPADHCTTLEEWFLQNHSPGISVFLNSLNMTPEEKVLEYEIWRSYTTRLTPSFFPGFLDMLRKFREKGGYIVVSSHSEEDQIRRHYDSVGFKPDLVYAYLTSGKNKPDPWPIHDLCAKLNVVPADVCVLDDLSPGITMAKTAGAWAAGAMWAHSIPTIKQYMAANCDGVFSSVAEFEEFLFRT
ncbi:HAD family hydrolase [Pelomyxa schiedti]|nr:HAD family hydrolase [Pelomyxa schiedti]